MEMRLNERKQQNEHNQKKGIVNREIIPHLCRNVYPEKRFCGHIAETCTRKRDFGYISDGRRGVGKADKIAPFRDGKAELVAELPDKLRLTGLGYIISWRAISAIPNRIIVPAIVIAIACITHHAISFQSIR